VFSKESKTDLYPNDPEKRFLVNLTPSSIPNIAILDIIAIEKGISDMNSGFGRRRKQLWGSGIGF
jgi:hypothetical protein